VAEPESLEYRPEDFSRIKRMLEQSAFVRHVGLRLESLRKGLCEVCLQVDAVHGNAYGGLHGGVIATLVDTVSGVAAWTMASPGERVATVELKVNFIAALQAHDVELRASGRVVHRGRTTAVVEADVTTDQGRLVARGLGTFMYLGGGEGDRG
jgi:uncharacterized protein (TIGR00369 family)